MSDSERRYGPTIDLQGFDMDTVSEPSRLPLLVMIALVVLAAFAGVVWLAYTQGVQRGRESVSRELTAQEFWKVRKPAEPAYTGLKIYQPPSAAEQAANRTAAAPAKPSAGGTIPLLRPTAGATPDVSPAPRIAASPAAVARNQATIAPPQPQARKAAPSKATLSASNPTSAPAAESLQRVASHAPTELTKPAAAPPMPMHPITAPDSFVSATPTPSVSTPKPAPAAAKPAASAPKQAVAAAPAKKSAAAPTSESTPTPTSPSEPALVTGVVLQIGSYKSDAEARQSWQTFKSAHDAAAGYRSDVREVHLGAKGTWYRLRIGPFPDKQSALETCRKLKADGASCLLAQ